MSYMRCQLQSHDLGIITLCRHTECESLIESDLTVDHPGYKQALAGGCQSRECVLCLQDRALAGQLLGMSQQLR